MPVTGKNIKFKNYHKQVQVPFVIYADFKSIIKPYQAAAEINLKSEAAIKHVAMDIRLSDMMVHHPM